MRLTKLLTDKEIELANDYSTREETKRKKGDYTFLGDAKPFDAINKLGQLEDIEEELGIDLITLFKALMNEYIFIKQDNKIYENNVEFSFNKDEKGWYINLEVCHFDKLYFKDYGKTWALTKEELL